MREVQRAREVAATVKFGVIIQACARRWLAKRKVGRWLMLREQQEQARLAYSPQVIESQRQSLSSWRYTHALTTPHYAHTPTSAPVCYHNPLTPTLAGWPASPSPLG